MGTTIEKSENVFNAIDLPFDNIVHDLGPDGVGAINLKGILRNDFRLRAIDEMDDESKVRWWDAGDTYVNDRHVKIIQNHDVFALKLSTGDNRPIEKVPLMLELAKSTE